jgi:hypothetical protein
MQYLPLQGQEEVLQFVVQLQPLKKLAPYSPRTLETEEREQLRKEYFCISAKRNWMTLHIRETDKSQTATIVLPVLCA